MRFVSLLTPPVTIFEDWHLVFIPPKQTGDVLLVGKDYQKRYGDRKRTI
jgi:hypothetical protein